MQTQHLKLLQITAFSVGITLLNQRIIRKDDIEFVTEFPCLLGHPVYSQRTFLGEFVLFSGFKCLFQCNFSFKSKFWFGLCQAAGRPREGELFIVEKDGYFTPTFEGPSKVGVKYPSVFQATSNPPTPPLPTLCKESRFFYTCVKGR